MWLNQGDASVDRDTPYGLQINTQPRTPVPWSEMEFNIEKIDYLDHFQILKPKLDGNLATPEMERKCIEYAYDWFMYMTTHEADREVFEASVLIVAAITILEEKASTTMGCSIFGFPLDALLEAMDRALHPRASKRLRALVAQSVDSHGSRQEGCLEKQIKTLQSISSCYFSYMQWRNVDGYYEVAMLCSFAAMGESCAELTVGVANDILEAAILAHDTHSVLRHFEEDEIANCHRYLHSNLQTSISLALKRVALLRNRIRFDPTIPLSIKKCAMVSISACHSFNYACRRYRYGADFAAATSFVNSSHQFDNPFKSPIPADASQSYSELIKSIV
ncbi:hypothetical protein DSO57_1028848 [Entomophthora muscae]|uniref:Uncharacterized protein n=1 Tax=Entomophthora muscae TaxID=34485 RepID=A0ACC2SQJ8_9FUNG|nr:hypothetical protein DSO57_1028848 [Entomophthora muscae]